MVILMVIIVHYRVGSLERNTVQNMSDPMVHYRVGSLEIETQEICIQHSVHYRVGSLEIRSFLKGLNFLSSLPCR